MARRQSTKVGTLIQKNARIRVFGHVWQFLGFFWLSNAARYMISRASFVFFTRITCFSFFIFFHFFIFIFFIFLGGKNTYIVLFLRNT